MLTQQVGHSAQLPLKDMKTNETRQSSEVGMKRLVVVMLMIDEG